MPKRGIASNRIIALIAIISLVFMVYTANNTSAANVTPVAMANAKIPILIPAELMQQAQTQGTVKVIVMLNTSFTPEGSLSSTSANMQRNTITTTQSQLLSSLSTQVTRIRHQFRYIPAVSLEVTAAGLQQLGSSPLVTSIHAIPELSLELSDSTQLIGATTAWDMGYDGSGQVVAIIDDGIMGDHPFLSSKIIKAAEACFTQSTEDPCPNGTSMQIGADAAEHRGILQMHGSHVAGIIAGWQASGTPASGVARGANIIPINVFYSPDQFGIEVKSTGDDIIAGLEYVYSIRGSYNIAAVNMSLGVAQNYNTTYCDTFEPAIKLAIDNLRSVNIATIVGSGNDADVTGTFQNGISFPSCISSAVSVGATDKSDNIASFSQSANILSLLAPGVGINSSIPLFGDPEFAELDGTSMAAPHVSGAWAILKQKMPNATVSQLLQALQSTGYARTDARNGVTVGRIRIDLALAQLSGTPLPTSTISPSATPTTTKSATPTNTASVTPSRTNTPTTTKTNTPTRTLTSTSTPTSTPTLTATSSPSRTSTLTRTTTVTVPPPTATPTTTRTGTPSTARPDTIGIFRSSGAIFYLRNSNTTGFADSSLVFGAATDFPITGDWNGDGIDTPGVYRQSTGQFFLTDSTADPAILHYTFVLGTPNDQPIVGDWDGDGKDGVGVFRPTNGLIYLKNGLTTGFADFQMVLGIPGDVGIAGDWNGDGKDSPGVYRPSNQVFFLSNSTCNCSVFADYQLGLGLAGDTPFVGDWDGNGTSGVGVYRQSNGLTYIKNALTTGFADAAFTFGSASDYPLAGYWVRTGTLSSGQPAPTFQP